MTSVFPILRTRLGSCALFSAASFSAASFSAASFSAASFSAALVCAALFSVATLHAQVTATAPAVTAADTPQRFDLYAGAAYSHFNPGYVHQSRATNLLGWNGSATAWFSRTYGVEATARGVYGSFTIPANNYGVSGSSNMSEHIFLFGPSFRLLRTEKYTAGGHVLLGGAYGSFDQGYHGSGIQPFATGIYNNQLAFAGAIGGWGDYNLTPVSPRLALRFVGDYQPTRYGNTTQNEFVGTVGIVYKLGLRGGK